MVVGCYFDACGVLGSCARQLQPAKDGRIFCRHFHHARQQTLVHFAWLGQRPHQNCTWVDANVRVEKSLALSLTDTPSPDRP